MPRSIAFSQIGSSIDDEKIDELETTLESAYESAQTALSESLKDDPVLGDVSLDELMGDLKGDPWRHFQHFDRTAISQEKAPPANYASPYESDKALRDYLRWLVERHRYYAERVLEPMEKLAARIRTAAVGDIREWIEQLYHQIDQKIESEAEPPSQSQKLRGFSRLRIGDNLDISELTKRIREDVYELHEISELYAYLIPDLLDHQNRALDFIQLQSINVIDNYYQSLSARQAERISGTNDELLNWFHRYRAYELPGQRQLICANDEEIRQKGRNRVVRLTIRHDDDGLRVDEKNLYVQSLSSLRAFLESLDQLAYKCNHVSGELQGIIRDYRTHFHELDMALERIELKTDQLDNYTAKRIRQTGQSKLRGFLTIPRTSVLQSISQIERYRFQTLLAGLRYINSSLQHYG